MTRTIDIPGVGRLELEHVLFDQNGTLTDRGELIDGVSQRVTRIGERFTVHILTADTFGTLSELTRELGVDGHVIATGADKLEFMTSLDAGRCIAIGNGRNDVPMLSAAALGVAIVGPEGASAEALATADIVCGSILDALDLVLDEQALVATLRV